MTAVLTAERLRELLTYDPNTPNGAADVPNPRDCTHRYPLCSDPWRCVLCGLDFRDGDPQKPSAEADVLAVQDALWRLFDTVEAGTSQDYRALQETGLMRSLHRHKTTRAAVAALIARNAELEAERNMLGQAIADAAHKAGITRADAVMDGPTLLMLCDDLATCAAMPDTIIAERDALIAERDALREDRDALLMAARGVKFDIYELTLPELREAFDGAKVICVVQQETVKPLRKAMARTAAGEVGNG